jgi:hypothetical protein
MSERIVIIVRKMQEKDALMIENDEKRMVEKVENVNVMSVQRNYEKNV